MTFIRGMSHFCWFSIIMRCNFYCFKFSPVCVLIYLTIINFFVYMDRGMLASVLSEVEDGLDITASEAGALGSIFIVGYIISAPLFAHGA